MRLGWYMRFDFQLPDVPRSRAGANVVWRASPLTAISAPPLRMPETSEGGDAALVSSLVLFRVWS